MLSLKSGEILAKSLDQKTTIYYTPSKKIPSILDVHPLDNICRELLYKIKKKYNLKKKIKQKRKKIKYCIFNK